LQNNLAFLQLNKKKEEWIIGTGGCACCFLTTFLIAPGIIVHTSYRVGVEGSLYLGYHGGDASEKFWNAQLIYDVVQIKSPKRLFKNITKLHIYTGIGVGEYDKSYSSYESDHGSFKETENTTEMQGIIVSLGTDIVIKFSGCLALRRPGFIIGAKIPFLSPWYDRRYKKVIENEKIVEETETIRKDLLFKTFHCILPFVPYIYFQINIF